MVKVVPFAPKPAVAKLPLAARIKELVGTDFTININAAEVWAYAEEGNTSAGTCFSRYVEGFISAIKNFMDKFDDNGKAFFNEAVTQAAGNPLGDKGETITSEILEGRRLNDTMLPAIESAPREGCSLSAKSSIENDFEGEIDELREEINKLVGTEVTLDPKEIYKALAALKDNAWQARIGATAMKYFQGMKYQLESQGFKDDEMLQEGLQEVIETKRFKLRVVAKTNSTIETIIEDGVVYVQCVADR
ncbi:hypothetical protein B0H17DRAFT_1152778 [Mycena rosella]|uniref:Uncharacterized protein n=1 Tax=Mycena rosella TaxID=1033263 RepID=A0AAD7FCI6_MYCRO|nr:hypothetical protein B0H17DRAFT_1152778 [Mycena rosella]